MQTLKNKTIFIIGGSRGIGEAIALRAARDGANIIIAAKSEKPHPSLPGTIFSYVCTRYGCRISQQGRCG